DEMKKLLTVALLALAQGAAAQTISLSGAGSTFAAPLYTKMFAEYKTLKGVEVNYQGIGSGAGKKQITAQTIDFAGTDAPMTDAEEKAAPGKIVHIPMAISAVVPIYNLPGVTAQLKFDGQLLSDIYRARVTKWNDPEVGKLNPGVNLPNLPITVVHRSDGSGTTSIWVDFLAKTSPDWAKDVSTGAQQTVNWPTGLGGQGNAGVAGLVKQTPGAIGYSEITYANQNKLLFGTVKNASGKFISGGDFKAIAAAAASKPLPGDTRVSITNAGGNGYPVAGFTWVLLYKDQKYGNRSEAQAKALVNLVYWMTHDGQKYAQPLDYGPIPEVAQTRAEALIAGITYGGKKLR
ncbi:MAG TPA: phosphate ABC transporter substrate-binding protein PstS, partial [Deinococcales bacterium]|nr:phosphate ABC transporter substrate-binding protein PstS [Deinococcales bacterium]